MVSLQPATLLAAVAPGEYQLDPGRTSIDIKMKTNWGLQTVRATFRIDHGGFRVDGGGRLSSVSATGSLIGAVASNWWTPSMEPSTP